MPKAKRNYTKENKWESSPTQKKHRAERGRARYALEKEGKVHKGDGKEVDHKRMLAEGGSNSRKNLRVISRHANRVKQPKHKGKGK